MKADNTLLVCVIDDMALFSKKMHCMVSQYLAARSISSEICVVSNPQELKALDISALDILIADIDLGQEQENGITLAKYINHINPRCQIIFVSSYLNYATEVYSANHTWFILKKQLEQKLPMALGKALENLSPSSGIPLVLKRGREQFMIDANTIICIESLQRKVLIYCTDRIEEAYSTIYALEKQLPSKKFVRCHNSYIVNLSMVEVFSASSLTLSKDITVPISRQYKAATKAAFMEHSVMMLEGITQ